MHHPPHAPDAGGAERYAGCLADATGATLLSARWGHEHALTREPGFAGRRWSVGVPLGGGFKRSWHNALAQVALADLMQRCRPDVVHIHHLAHLGLGCAQVARRAGAAVVMTLHDYHPLCVRGQLVNRDRERCEGPSVQRCAECVVEHLRAPTGLAGVGRVVRRVGLERVARGALARAPVGAPERSQIQARQAAALGALSSCHRLLSPSTHLAQRYAAHTANPVHVLDLPLVAELVPAPPPMGPFRLLFVGSLIPTKGPEVLLQAFARLPSGQAELVLRGPMPEYDGQPDWRSRMEGLLRQTPGARWQGPFQDAERQAVYANADVLVAPSTWEENSPLVLREARAVGLRVVASDLGGVREVDPDARLVPPNDVGALSAALAEELRIGRGRREHQEYPLPQHLQSLEKHYRLAMERAKRS